MNVFSDLARPIIDRPGNPFPVPRSKQAAGRLGGSKARKLNHLPEVPNPWRLTPCQVQVVQMLVDGKTNEQIAAELGIVVKSVEVHVRNTTDAMEVVEGSPVNRVRAAVLWDRFLRGTH